jgi:hypothetical protein
MNQQVLYYTLSILLSSSVTMRAAVEVPAHKEVASSGHVVSGVNTDDVEVDYDDDVDDVPATADGGVNFLEMVMAGEESPQYEEQYFQYEESRQEQEGKEDSKIEESQHLQSDAVAQEPPLQSIGSAVDSGEQRNRRRSRSGSRDGGSSGSNKRPRQSGGYGGRGGQHYRSDWDREGGGAGPSYHDRGGRQQSERGRVGGYGEGNIAHNEGRGNYGGGRGSGGFGGDRDRAREGGGGGNRRGFNEDRGYPRGGRGYGNDTRNARY